METEVYNYFFPQNLRRIMLTYITKGTCSRQILFNVTPDDKVVDVKFIGGCSGNLQGIAKLVNGKPIDEVIELLSGIKWQAC